MHIITTKFQGDTYRVNDYMRGTCPFCHEFEAPITAEELLTAPLHILRTHKGSTRRVTDRHTAYPRQTWREFFACPCGGHFAVPYSSV
jgi:hypothetical protein